MPRFTIKDMLIATTLIAVGAGAIVYLLGNLDELGEDPGSAWGAGMTLWFGGGAFIGAGLFTPFKRPWTGAVNAVVFQIFLAMLPR